MKTEKEANKKMKLTKEKLKKMCLKVIELEKENSKQLHKYYDKQRKLGKGFKCYFDYLKRKKGKKTHLELNKARNKLYKILPFGNGEYESFCLDEKGILMVLEVLK